MYQKTRKIRHLLNAVLDCGSVLIFFFFKYQINVSNNTVAEAPKTQELG